MADLFSLDGSGATRQLLAQSIAGAVNNTDCYCDAWYTSLGDDWLFTFGNVMTWIVFALSILVLVFYVWHSFHATTGWEECYVAVIELGMACLELYTEFYTPFTLFLSNGNIVAWLRYAEWLMSCPVILIHMANLTGLNNSYSPRTMSLLISDVGCIVLGSTAAMATGWVKWVFFCMALSFGLTTYYNAARVYMEAFHTVPKGICRQLVMALAWIYFTSWSCFPILFILGPEGLDHIPFMASSVAHNFLDLISKNLWGMLAHMLRVKIHEHILIHGDIRTKTKVSVAGQDVEVETFVEPGTVEDAV
nr:protein 123 [synthetic construct]